MTERASMRRSLRRALTASTALGLLTTLPIPGAPIFAPHALAAGGTGGNNPFGGRAAGGTGPADGQNGGAGDPGVSSAGGAGGGGGGGAGGGRGGSGGTSNLGVGGTGGSGGVAAGAPGSNGNNAAAAGGGGGGQHGFTGVTLPAGNFTGGQGGNGGNGNSNSGAGGGGEGGYGAYLSGNASTVTGAVQGGRGGDGGNGNSIPRFSGSGGTGGIGIFFSNAATLTIDAGGSITGGNGGSTPGTNPGAGGAGVVGDGLTIINAGGISGGFANAGIGAQANAISFTGDANRLTSNTGSTYGGGFAIATGASLTLDQTAAAGANASATYANVISGAGSLIVTSDGGRTVTLSGVNTYTGGTTLSAGAINVGSAGALGTTGTLSFTGGTLRYSTANQTDYSGRFSQAAGQLYSIDTNGQVVTYASALTSQGGSLTKLGANTLTLTADNTYTGGTTVSAGTLQLGNGGATGSILGNVALLTTDPANIGSLSFNRSDTYTFNGAISGAGSVSQRGSGTAILTNTNTYSGSTGALAGTLQASNAAALGTGNIIVSVGQLRTTFTGTLTNSQLGFVGTTGRVTAAAGTSATYGGTLASLAGAVLRFGSATDTGTVVLANTSTAFGAGSSFALDGGTLDVRGTANGNFTGTANVNAGTLSVNGVFGDTAANSAQVIVNNGGTLGGTGTVAGQVTVNAGGTLSAGNPLGTLNVGGNVTLAAGSTSLFELGAPGVVGGVNNDLVTVGGNLSVDNASSLALQTTAGGQIASGYYTLFDVAGTTAAGRFGTVTNGGTNATANVTQIVTNGGNAPSQYNVLLANNGQRVQFWDGTNLSANGVVNGGAGTWNATNTNWTTVDGAINDQWRSQVGVFGGAAGGAVTVAGTQSFQALQFRTNGYALSGGALALLADSGISGSTAASITVDGGIAASIASPLQGTAGLTKFGGGTLTLSGANTYTGLTTVTGGTLANTGSLAGSVTNTTAGTFTNGGSVAGSLTNAGTATNSGSIAGAVANSGTFSNAGTVGGGLSNTAGTATNTGTINGGATIVAGTFNTNAATSIVNGPLANSATVNARGQINGAVTNNAGATVNVVGPLSGVTTFANNGTLDLGGTAFTVGSLSGSSTAAVLRNGALTTNGDNSSTSYAGTIVDGAVATSLTKNGTGSLTLTGTNTYSGGTTIAAGTLVTAVAGLGSGAITDNAALVINQPGDATLGNALNGTGSLTKQGAGTLTYTGAGTLSGPTTVATGGLVVNGSLAASPVSVANGAVIGGTGTIGGLTVQSGATVAPGATTAVGSLGTLNVAGNVLFAAQSLYQVDATAAGQSDRIAATGTATLQGGTVQVTAGTGQYAPSTRYTILTATAGLSGQFAGVTSNFAFLTPSLSYDANDAFLTLARNDLSFGSAAVTRNQGNVAAAAQALGFGTPIFNSIAVLSAAQARQAFDALSGEVHSSAVTGQFATGYLVREAILDRLRFGETPSFGGIGAEGIGQRFAPGTTLPAVYTADLPGRTTAPVPVSTQLVAPNPVAVWGQGFGSFGSIGGDGNAARLDQQTSGFVLGADTRLDQNWRVGVAGGYTFTTLDITARQSTGTVESGYGALYAGGSYGPVQLRFGGAYAGSSLATNRAVIFPGFSENASARYGGSLGQVFGEAGYRIGSGNGYFEPFVGGAAIRISRDGFTERGGAAALTTRGEDYDIATSTVGVQAQGQIGALFGTTAPVFVRGLVGYRRAYGDVVPSTLFSFGAAGQTFLTAGVPIARDALVAQAGLDWQVSRNTTLSLAYTGQVGADRTQVHGVKGGFLYRW